MKNQSFTIRTSEAVTKFIGSWKGFFFHATVILLWIGYNSLYSDKAFDPFPFIFLNLALSTEAAISSCFILMSQNRSAERDRKTLEESYIANLEGRISFAEIADKLDKIENIIKKVNSNVQKEK